jgi:hypothetical protein
LHTRRILTCEGGGVLADFNGSDFRFRKPVCECQCDCACAGAKISNLRGRRREFTRDKFDKFLRFLSWNEGAPIGFDHDVSKLEIADDVLERLARAAPSH